MYIERERERDVYFLNSTERLLVKYGRLACKNVLSKYRYSPCTAVEMLSQRLKLA